MKKKSKKMFLVLAGIVIILIGVKALSSDASPQVDTAVDGSLTFSQTTWDLGDVSMQGGVNTKEIAFTNDSSAPITVTQLETSCMCTTVQIVHADGSKSGLKGMVGHGGGVAALSETIDAGETATLLVNFDPNAHGPSAIGPITRTVMLHTNSQQQPETELMFSGNVIK